MSIVTMPHVNPERSEGSQARCFAALSKMNLRPAFNGVEQIALPLML